MLTDIFYKRLQKIIVAAGLTTNELFQVKCHLERQYNTALVQENIMKLINNYGSCKETIKNKKIIKPD